MYLKTAGILILLSVPFVLMSIWAIVNAAQKDFSTMRQKVIWIIVASFPFIGFIIYLLFGARRGKISD
jgi:hypothetical protein